MTTTFNMPPFPTDRKDRDDHKHVATWFRQVLPELAKLLGWNYVPPRVEGNDYLDSIAIGRLTDADSHELIFSRVAAYTGQTAKNPRVEVVGAWPFRGSQMWTLSENDRKGRSMSITFAAHRPLADMVKDIQKRLLPDYFAMYGEALAQYNAHNKHMTGRTELLNELVKLMPEMGTRTNTQGETRTTTWYQQDKGSCDVTVHSPTSVEIRIQWTNINVVRAVLKTLGDQINILNEEPIPFG